jgi:hypothetical protein
MMRFAAPADTSAISLTCGEFAVKNGHIEVPHDVGQGDLAGLAAHGFRIAHKAPPAPEKAADAPSAPEGPKSAPEPARKAKKSAKKA